MSTLTTPARFYTALIALSGAAVFTLLGLPLAFLLGPMAACLIAAFAQVRMQDFGKLGTVFRTFLGVAIGASFSPDLFERLPAMAATLAFMPVFTLLCVTLGYPLFRRVWGFDKATSLYAAMPGGLQDMLMFGEMMGGDIRALSLIQATRVLFVVSAAPVIIGGIWGIPLDAPIGVPAAQLPLWDIPVFLACGLIGWKLGLLLRLPGASILGPLALTAALSLTGVITHRPPAEMILAAQLFIGIAVGVRYTGITLRELRVDVTAGLAYCVVLTLMSAMVAGAIYTLGLAPFLEAFLAFAPGGQAEMAVLAIVVGADAVFVVTHHMVRVIVVLAAAPAMTRFLR